MNSYTTVRGDTWDLIAYKVWGNEYLLPLLFEANQAHSKTLIFQSGVQLNIPTIDYETAVTDRPVWFNEAEEP